MFANRSKFIKIIILFLLLLLLGLRFRQSQSPPKSTATITTQPKPVFPLPKPRPLQPDIVFHGSTTSANLAITFDADMTPGMVKKLKSGEIKSYYNQAVIKVLEDNHTPATLFLTGMWIEQYPEATKELAKNSLFELANHSYSHPSFYSTCFGLAQIQETEKTNQITKTQKLLKDYTGKDNYLFRFPGGCYSQKELDLAKNLGVLPIQWNSAGPDSFNPNTQQIIKNLKKNTQNGSIIVLHLNGNKNAPKTAEVISEYIPWAKAQGYTFVKVSDLLQITLPAN
jgi:peptidoglycan/xylan/chitin deacetylase (PgdA/CDA1 family)